MLRKVRLKTDPAFTKNGEISKFQGYEGFILAEMDKVARMYITECGEMVDIPIDMIDVNSGLTQFEKLKLNTLLFLKSKKSKGFNDPIIKIVMMCSTIDDLETMLMNNGLTERDFIDILKIDYATV